MHEREGTGERRRQREGRYGDEREAKTNARGVVGREERIGGGGSWSRSCFISG